MSCTDILEKACLELKWLLHNITVSSIYQTKAMYVTNQCDFHNMALAGYVPDETNPYDLLSQINLIESKYGRNRDEEIRFGPRSLDIDIELFGEDCIKSEKLIVPHERLKERAFVLVPMLEILTKSADNKKRDIVKNWLDELSEEEKNLLVIKSADEIIVS